MAERSVAIATTVPDGAFASPGAVREGLRRVRYLADERIAGVVYLAGRLGKPVLVEGPAGTGKTQVLTARVLRLLLQGARPESILCLTFTKAAAAEMANRIGARLVEYIGVETLMWGSDYPHPDGVWPESSKYIEEQFAGLSPEVVHKITCENAGKFYGLIN